MAISALSVVALGLTSCSAGEVLNGAGDVNTIDAATAGAIESAVQNAISLSGSTSAIVGVWQNDSAAYVQAFGDGVTANSQIRAAQASQPVMCAALLDLVAEGKLSLDRKVSDDLTRQVGLRDITYGDLCKATSGLADFKTGIGDIFANNPIRPWNERELLAQGLARSPLSWPGLDLHLSDTNTVLLADALRVVTGKSLPDLLQQHVFSKAGMKRSFYPNDVEADTTLPGGGMNGTAYQVAGGAPLCDASVVDATQVSPSMLSGAGATVTTVTDLKDFYTQYLGGAFGADSAALITNAVTTSNPARDASGQPTPDSPAPDPAAPLWGFGLEQVGSLYGMSGSMTGTITAAYHDPSSGFTVVVSLNNSTAGARFARTLALQLAALGGEQTTWTADEQGAALATMAVCPAPPEGAPAEQAPAQ